MNMDVSKNRGKTCKMDGLNNGSKPYEQMDDLGVCPLCLETPIYIYIARFWGSTAWVGLKHMNLYNLFL